MSAQEIARLVARANALLMKHKVPGPDIETCGSLYMEAGHMLCSDRITEAAAEKERFIQSAGQAFRGNCN